MLLPLRELGIYPHLNDRKVLFLRVGGAETAVRGKGGDLGGGGSIRRRSGGWGGSALSTAAKYVT